MLNIESKLLVQLALIEDVGTGDVTTESTIDENAAGSAILLSREEQVVCGHDIVHEVFAQVSQRFGYQAAYTPVVPEGTRVPSDTILGRAQGSMRAILIAERSALNFMQHLSGIATHSKRLVEQAPKNLVLLDTRKTKPGYRELEKHAVAIGGATNHRHGLYDQVLIKNNHVDAVGGDIAETIRRARDYAKEGILIEVEVRSLEELHAALIAEPDKILLDNMNDEKMREAVAVVRSKEKTKPIFLEASGGITAARLEGIAATGVDAVSLGALTHSAPSMDISLRYEAT